MNILHISAVKSWGGGENHIENLCIELQKISPSTQNTVLCIKDGLFEKRLSETNIPYFSVKLGFKMDPRFFLKLIEICKSNKIDLLHIHDSTALTLCIMGDHLYSLPPFIFSKKTSFPIRTRKQTLYKYNYPKIKRILCVSNATKNVAGSMLKNPQKLSCVYHGTNVSPNINSQEIDLRKKLKLEANTVIIGNIANHIWPKDLETFIEVANDLINVEKMKNLHFIQIGAFSKNTINLMAKIEKYRLTPYISFLDSIPNAASLIPQFDISLMTSKSEGIPQFIYESFLKKVPVVSTNVGGISEIIEHDKNGLLAPAGNHKTLAKLIVDLLKDQVKREQFKEHSYKLVLENFTTEIMAQKTLNQYKTVLNGK